MDIERSGVPGVIRVPDLANQRLARHQFAGVADKDFEQLRLLWREPGLFAMSNNLALREIELEGAGGQCVSLVARQEASNTIEKLSCCERMHQHQAGARARLSPRPLRRDEDDGDTIKVVPDLATQTSSWRPHRSGIQNHDVRLRALFQGPDSAVDLMFDFDVVALLFKRWGKRGVACPPALDKKDVGISHRLGTLRKQRGSPIGEAALLLPLYTSRTRRCKWEFATSVRGCIAWPKTQGTAL
jgi:hypothetical protein